MGNASEYNKRYRQKLKNEVIDLLGGCCAMCGVTEDLQLHHISYDVDSIRHDNSRMTDRYYEARDHPERFMLLCSIHHPWGANALPPRMPITRWDELWREDRLWRYKVREWGERSTKRKNEYQRNR